MEARQAEAIELARAQQSGAFQLRAANSLATLQRNAESLALVTEALAPFTDVTSDVITARALLA